MDSQNKSKETSADEELNPTADAIMVAEGLAILGEAITKMASAIDRLVDKLPDDSDEDSDPAGIGGFDMGGNKIG